MFQVAFVPFLVHVSFTIPSSFHILITSILICIFSFSVFLSLSFSSLSFSLSLILSLSSSFFFFAFSSFLFSLCHYPSLQRFYALLSFSLFLTFDSSHRSSKLVILPLSFSLSFSPSRSRCSFPSHVFPFSSCPGSFSSFVLLFPYSRPCLHKPWPDVRHGETRTHGHTDIDSKKRQTAKRGGRQRRQRTF